MTDTEFGSCVIHADDLKGRSRKEIFDCIAATQQMSTVESAWLEEHLKFLEEYGVLYGEG